MKLRGTSIAILVSFALSVLILTFQNCGGGSNSGASSYSSLGSTSPGYVPNEIIIRMNSQNSEGSLKTWAVNNGLVLKSAWEMNNTTRWSWAGPATVSQLQQTLAATTLAPDMLYSEPNYFVYSIDPQSEGGAQTLTYSQVEALPVSQQVQTTVNIGESQIWSALPKGNAKPIVAVIDTGIDLTHNAFTASGAIWKNPGEIPNNGIDDDGDGFVDDVNGWNWVDGNNNVQDDIGHGTHCAGIVLGVGQNALAASPTAAKIQIMPLKFIGPNGGLTSDAISAVYFAASKGARVMSNSWGGPSASMALEDAITYAYQQNIIFVVAAGNASTNNDVTPQYPASYTVPNVLAIAATDSNDFLASFSNYGPKSVAFGAPGVSILSTYPTNVFAYLSGTSMSTPFVAGAAAYMAYERPTMGGYQIRNLIIGNTNPDSNLNGETVTAGRLNAYAAYQAAGTATINNTLPAYQEVQFTSQQQGSGSSGGGGCGMIVSFDNGSDFGGPGGLGGMSAVVALYLLLPLMFKSWLKRHARQSASA